MNSLVCDIAHQASIDQEKAMIALLTVSAHMKRRFPALKSVFELILEERTTTFTNEMIAISDFPNPMGLN